MGFGDLHMNGQCVTVVMVSCAIIKTLSSGLTLHTMLSVESLPVLLDLMIQTQK